MAREPRILASFLHGTLDAIDAIDGDLGRRVRAELKPASLEEIQNAWAATWLPIRLDVELTEVFFRLAGSARGCQVMRGNLAATFEQPILRPLIEGALRVLGRHPGKVLRWAPRVWSLLFRDMGRLEVEIQPGRAAVLMLDLPAEVAESREYLLGSAAAIAAVFDLTGYQGTCELREQGRGRARFELTWQDCQP
jgi:hypothetical protein